MGYVEKAMGDSEYALYSTHQHVIVLIQRILASLFVFIVFLGIGLAVLLPGEGDDSAFSLRCCAQMAKAVFCKVAAIGVISMYKNPFCS